jgi:hypothetical protein
MLEARGKPRQEISVIDVEQKEAPASFSVIAELGIARHYDMICVAGQQIEAQASIIIPRFREVRLLYPDFKYNAVITNYSEGSKTITLDPYDQVIRDRYPCDTRGVLCTLGRIGAPFDTNLLQALVGDFYVQKERERTQQTVDPPFVAAFSQGVKRLGTALYERHLFEEYHFQNGTYQGMVNAIARNPDQVSAIVSLPEAVPDFFVLLDEKSKLHAYTDDVMREVFTAEDVTARAREIATIFAKDTPAWKQNTLYACLRYGKRLDRCSSDYVLTEVPVVEEKFDLTTDVSFTPRVFGSLSESEKRALLKHTGGRDVSEMDSVSVNMLSDEQKRITFAYLLSRVAERSTDSGLRQQADVRNRFLACEPFHFVEGTYAHGSHVSALAGIFTDGYFPREALGDEFVSNNYFPFHVSYARFPETPTERIGTALEFSGALTFSQASDVASVVYLISDRQGDTLQKQELSGKDIRTGMINRDHALVFGGMPAVETTAIVLQDPSKTFNEVRERVVENDFYIPVYAPSGQLLLSPDEYDRLRIESLHNRTAA